MLLLCNYYITYRCNSYCTFCDFGDHKKYDNSSFAAREHFEKNVSELAELGVKFIDLTGGEPLLHKDIHYFAAFAKAKKMQTSITTNTLLYPKFAERLAGKINLLHFSLDSPDEDEHNSLRRIDCYKSVLKSIGIAKSLGEYPDIIFTATDQTYHKIERMHEIASKHGLVLLVNPVFTYFGNPGLSLKALEYISEYADRRNDVYLNKGFVKLRLDGGNKISDPSCKAVSRVIVISPDNEIILPCWHFKNNAVKIDRSISGFRNSPLFSYYRGNEGKFSFCEGCTVNCYFEPSFAFPVNKYSVVSLSSKFKYSYNKLVKQKLARFFRT